jgi:hypothetical protein
MTNSIRSNFQVHPFHLVSPLPWPIYTSISIFVLLMIYHINGIIFINRKRTSEDQSTDHKQDLEAEAREAKNLLNDTLKKVNHIEEIINNKDGKNKDITHKDANISKDIEKQYPTFFDEESGNLEDKKSGYRDLKEYLEEELAAIPGIKETNPMQESLDRDTKKIKPLSSDESEGKPSSTESSDAKGKGSLIDDYANPNLEFGDWTGGDD